MLPFGYGFGQKQLQRLEQSFYKEKSENFIFVMMSSKYTKKLEKCCKGIKTQSLKEAYYGINPLSKNTIIERRKKNMMNIMNMMNLKNILNMMNLTKENLK